MIKLKISGNKLQKMSDSVCFMSKAVRQAGKIVYMIIATKKHTMFGGVLYEAASFLGMGRVVLHGNDDDYRL